MHSLFSVGFHTRVVSFPDIFLYDACVEYDARHESHRRLCIGFWRKVGQRKYVMQNKWRKSWPVNSTYYFLGYQQSCRICFFFRVPRVFASDRISRMPWFSCPDPVEHTFIAPWPLVKICSKVLKESSFSTKLYKSINQINGLLFYKILFGFCTIY